MYNTFFKWEKPGGLFPLALCLAGSFQILAQMPSFPRLLWPFTRELPPPPLLFILLLHFSFIFFKELLWCKNDLVYLFLYLLSLLAVFPTKTPKLHESWASPVLSVHSPGAWHTVGKRRQQQSTQLPRRYHSRDAAWPWLCPVSSPGPAEADTMLEVWAGSWTTSRRALSFWGWVALARWWLRKKIHQVEGRAHAKSQMPERTHQILRFASFFWCNWVT